MVMEKRVAHHRLTDIQAQMVSVESMLLTLSAKQGIRKAGMDMHTRAIVSDDRFGHESRRLSVRMRDIMDDIFQNLVPVGTFHQAIESGSYFALTCSRNFVMMNFDTDTHFFQGYTHGRAYIL